MVRKKAMLLKVLLTIQSMMPIFLFLLLKNVCPVNNSIFLGCLNKTIVWVLLLLFCGLCWIAVQFLNRYLCISEEAVKIIKKTETENLDFVIAIIIPLVAETENAMHSPICFAVLLVFVAYCIYKANYWYANPVLWLLGYKTYTIEYDNAEGKSETTTAIVCPFSAETETAYIKQITPSIAVMHWCQKD